MFPTSKMHSSATNRSGFSAGAESEGLAHGDRSDNQAKAPPLTNVVRLMSIKISWSSAGLVGVSGAPKLDQYRQFSILNRAPRRLCPPPTPASVNSQLCSTQT